MSVLAAVSVLVAMAVGLVAMAVGFGAALSFHAVHAGTALVAVSALAAVAAALAWVAILWVAYHFVVERVLGCFWLLLPQETAVVPFEEADVSSLPSAEAFAVIVVLVVGLVAVLVVRSAVHSVVCFVGASDDFS